MIAVNTGKVTDGSKVFAKGTTFEDLAKIEPRLLELYEQIKKVSSKGDPKFCASRIWYRQYKPQMERLVGLFTENENPIIQSSKAYDLVYSTLYHALPRCRHPGPFC